MKKNFTLCFFIVFIALLFFPRGVNAQCPLGYTQDSLNWDHLDFLPSNNARYTGFYPSAAFPYNQNFAIGPRTLNFTMSPTTNFTLDGENGTNTAHAGSFASSGDDVQFTTTSVTNHTVTMTFDIDVANVKFSVFDLDVNQQVNITATDALGTGQIITIAKANAGSAITIGGSGTVSATATGPAAGYANNDNNGAINITVASPVSRVVITLNNAAGDIWLSDIAACVTGSFPSSYQQISRPFTGQPQYVLTVVNNNIYYTDPANGNAYFLFNEPGHDRLNSMAYDPYRRAVYYTYSLTDRVGLNPQNDKALKKYDVDTKTISVVIPNVNTFGIPTYESGVESGAATFYNGSLYLGIEGYTGTTGSGAYAAGRKSTIWKISFDVSGNPIAPAAQVFGVTSDNGVNAANIHDWSDFGISNGILYDFDGSTGGGTDFYHFNLMTGVRTRYAPSGVVPRQVSIGWDERLYNVDATIARYNGTNGIVAGTTFNITSPLGPTIPVGSSASWGDAAGPYRPFLDFGDAPASYDPDPLSPACHDTLTPNIAGKRTKLKLGADEDVEWLKKGVTTVEDNYEDGLTFVPIFGSMTGSYQAQVSVFNNSGSNATLIGWLDFNGNGLFDAIESSVAVNVPSLAGSQSFWLNWPSTPSTLPNGSYTYLRLRITSASYNMTANNATGYYNRGEVEDYRVVVDNLPLPVTMISFDAKLINNSKVKLAWSANEDISFAGYEVQRSPDGKNWEYVTFVPSSHSDGIQEYELTDNNSYKSTSHYRLKLNETNGQYKYSVVRLVKISGPSVLISLFPNPARDRATITITGDVSGQIADISIIDAKGTRLSSQKVILAAGNNSVELPVQPSWSSDIYIVQVNTDGMIVNKKLVLRR